MNNSESESELKSLKLKLRKLELESKLRKNLSKEFEDEIIKLQKHIYILSKEEFNINSTKQLGSILFEKLNLPHKKKNKSGGFSTNSEVLELLANEEFEVAKLVLKWRELNKNEWISLLD